jgi:hypothetical protein
MLNVMRTRIVGSEVFHLDRLTDGQKEVQTDRHNEDNRRFSQSCERAENQ